MKYSVKFKYSTDSPPATTKIFKLIPKRYKMADLGQGQIGFPHDIEGSQ